MSVFATSEPAFQVKSKLSHNRLSGLTDFRAVPSPLTRILLIIGLLELGLSPGWLGQLQKEKSG